MNITEGHFRLTPEQKRFRGLLQQYPKLLNYWDFAKLECDMEALRRDIGHFSHGEQLMAKFFASVWCGNDALSFPLVDASKSLDEKDLAVVVSWMSDAFFP